MHMIEARMKAPTHGTDIAFPAAFAKAVSEQFSTLSIGDPDALACMPLVGKQ